MAKKKEKSIGERIKEYRVREGLRQEDLAEKLGCTKNYIWMVENEYKGRKVSKGFEKLFEMIEKGSNE